MTGWGPGWGRAGRRHRDRGRIGPAGGRLSHAEARGWLSERLDTPLPPARDAALRAHLAACPTCREVAADYQRIRVELRALPAPPPPRDLTARTLAALDVEAGHGHAPRPAPTFRRRNATRSGGVAIGSLLTVALVAVVGILLAGPVVEIPTPLAGATPFSITPVQLAFVGVQNDVVRLYRTQIDRACPAAAQCTGLGAQADQVVDLPHTAAISALALDPAHRHAAIAAVSTAGGTTSYYILTLDGPSAGTGSAATIAPVVNGSASPAASPAASPSGSGRASASPRRSGPAGTVAGATPHPESTKRPATAMASHSPRPSSVTPIASPTAAAAATAPGVRSSMSPGSAAGIDTPQSTANVGGAGAGAPGQPTTPTLPAQAILEQVIPTGAAAAWSPDGGTLAFSAMPADGSAGSDIYVWHPGDAAATQITFDHASSFASWAGNRIVGSSVAPSPMDPSLLVPQSFVLDPDTGTRRMIRGPSLWLPSVDPTGRRVVAWSGTLEMSGVTPVPGTGQLVLASWPALDPYADTSPVATPTIVPVPSWSPTPSPTATATRAGLGSHAPGASGAVTTPAVGSPATTPGPGATDIPGASAAPMLETPEPLDAPAVPSAPRLQEWAVSWAPDGSAFAVWEGTAVGTDTGTLALHLVDPDTGALRADSPLGTPVPAARGFSVGLDRLAWTTPADGQGMHALRVVVWGPFGSGEVRSGQLQQGIVPAF